MNENAQYQIPYPGVEKFKIRRPFQNVEMQGSEKNSGRAVYCAYINGLDFFTDAAECRFSTHYAGRLSVGGMKPSSDRVRTMPRSRKLLLKPRVYCRAPSLIGSSILRSTSFLIW